jgi:nucleoside transporter
MSPGLWIRLSVMMVLQYLVWGIWLPGIAQFMGPESASGLGGIGLRPDQQGWIFTVYGFGAILGPMIIGQIADRYMATEKVLAGCHLVGGGLLLWASYQTSFWPLFLILFAYCNLYMPTMGLTNSITFRALGEGEQSKFPYIRLWGTIGWIIAGLFYGQYLALSDPEPSWGSGFLRPIFEPLSGLSFVGKPTFRDCLRIPGVISLLYGLYCFTLPHTPPVPSKPSDPIDKKSSILESLELMKNRSFAVLIVVTGLVGIMLAFYFGCENYFLGAIGAKESQIVQYMTLGQGAELALMFLVPLAVQKLGIKTTMIIGASAWALRFGLSAIGQPYWLMISTIALHGFAFGFFFVPAQMYVDRAASEDIKATAQNFLVFVVYGLGTILGSILSGRLRGMFLVPRLDPSTGETVMVTNWFAVWIGPTVLTLLCIAAFAFLFRETTKITKPAADLDPDPEFSAT